MTELNGHAKLEASRFPLIVYIHVPKTAGSTIKRVLQACTPRGDGNVQFVISDKAALLNLARNADWIGGHVPRDDVANCLTWLNRPIEYYASVREPVAQLVSNLNYSFERFSHGGYYRQLSRDDHCLDAAVMSTDFSNPAAIMNLLLEHASTYLNIQSRFVLGADFDVIPQDEIARRLATYTYVVTENNLSKLYRAFGFAQLPESADGIRANVAQRYLNARLFDSPQLQAFLAYYHRHDLRLYAMVRETSWSAEGRRPFRPALQDQGLFTFENFDEQEYLFSHADVAAAVKYGDYPSGRAHFEICGHKENRAIRQLALPSAAVCEPKPNEADISTSSVLERLRRLRGERARIAGGFQLPQHELLPKSQPPAAATPTPLADLN